MQTHVAAFLACLVLFSGLAGCATPQPDAIDDDGKIPLEAPQFAPAVRLPSIPPGAGEPNTAILPDGTLFVVAPSGLSKPNAHQGAAYMWRSTDHGQTWETLRQPYVDEREPTDPVFEGHGVFCSCDADIVASPDGWMYYTDWWIAGLAGPGNYLVEASSDGGKTWSVNSVPIPQNIVSSMDRQWLVAGPDGFVGLFYSFFGTVPLVTPPAPVFGLDRPGGVIEAVFSHDHGKTWTEPVAVVKPASDAAYQIGHPFMLPNGTVAMAYGKVLYTDGGGFWYDASEIRVASSQDQGKTWTDALVADVPHGFDNLWAVQGTADPATGQFTVAWAARSDNKTEDRTRQTLSGPRTQRQAAPESGMGLFVKQWGPLGEVGPVLVRGAGLNVLPWVTARDGAVAVSWYGGNATGLAEKAKTDWFAYVALAPKGLFTSQNYTVAPASHAPVKSGALCAKGASCASDRQLLDFGSLVFDAAGKLHVSLTRMEKGVPGIEVANQE